MIRIVSWPYYEPEGTKGAFVTPGSPGCALGGETGVWATPESGNFFKAQRINMEVIMDEMMSAEGKESQTPWSPKRRGSINMRGMRTSTWRERDRKIAGMGFPRA